MLRLISCIGILLCLLEPLYAFNSFFFWHRPQGKAQTAVTGTSELVGRLNAIVNEETTAAVSVYIKSMKYGDELYTRNIHHPLTPASTLKILTAEAALLYLGPNFRFTTQLYTDALDVQNGILQGNLYVVLSGDPTLTYFDLADLIQVLRAQQVYGIKGNVYIDNTAYDQNYYGPGWEFGDKNYCYAAPISASIINHNCFVFKVVPGKNAGALAQVVTSNKYFYPKIKNYVVTTKPKTRSSCTIRLAPNPDSSISLDGCMPSGQYAWGVSYVVTNVQDYDRALFKKLFQQFGMTVYGSVKLGSLPPNPTLVSTHISRPLHLLIYEMLKKSDNVIAGALFKKLGQKFSNHPGSWENGSLAVSQILSHYTGMNSAGLRILDGSGLSPSNLTTPAQMMHVLDFAFHNVPTSYPFISSLPIAGVDGTLKHRMTNITHRVRAKTGTISGVVSLAGYVVSADKEPLAFVVMVNGSKGFGWRYKAIEDQIATTLTQFKRKKQGQ